MKIIATQIFISVVAVFLGILHVVSPNYNMDAIGLALLAIAIAPWVAPLIKSFELPGGLKIELKDLEQATQKVETAGLLANDEEIEDLDYSFQYIINQDSNLALAGLRIELEKRLKELAKFYDIDPQFKSAGRLLRLFTEKGFVSLNEQGALTELFSLLNAAVHATKVDENATNWAMEIGPRILKNLDSRINHIKEKEKKLNEVSAIKFE